MQICFSNRAFSGPEERHTYGRCSKFRGIVIYVSKKRSGLVPLGYAVGEKEAGIRILFC
jgi:hypothetical protein